MTLALDTAIIVILLVLAALLFLLHDRAYAGNRSLQSVGLALTALALAVWAVTG